MHINCVYVVLFAKNLQKLCFSCFWNVLAYYPPFTLERKQSPVNFSIGKILFLHLFITDLKNTFNHFCLLYFLQVVSFLSEPVYTGILALFNNKIRIYNLSHASLFCRIFSI